MTQFVSQTSAGGMDRVPRLPKSASSSALSSLDRRRDRRASNPAAMLGDWTRRGPPPSSSAGAGRADSSGRRPSERSATSDGVLGHRPPKPHRGLHH